MQVCWGALLLQHKDGTATLQNTNSTHKEGGEKYLREY